MSRLLFIIAIFILVICIETGCSKNEQQQVVNVNTLQTEGMIKNEKTIKVDDYKNVPVIKDINLNVEYDEPDGLGNVYGKFVYNNNSDYTITKYAATVLLKDSNTKTYYMTYDIVSPGESSPIIDVKGPATGTVDDVEFLVEEVDYIDEKGNPHSVRCDYKAKEYTES